MGRLAKMPPVAADLAEPPRPPAPPRGGSAAGAPHVIGLFPEAGG